jgi:hypothetical protein
MLGSSTLSQERFAQLDGAGEGRGVGHKDGLLLRQSSLQAQERSILEENRIEIDKIGNILTNDCGTEDPRSAGFLLDREVIFDDIYDPVNNQSGLALSIVEHDNLNVALIGQRTAGVY